MSEFGKNNLQRKSSGMRKNIKSEKGMHVYQARRTLRNMILADLGRKKLPKGISEKIEAFLKSSPRYNEQILRNQANIIIGKEEKIEKKAEDLINQLLDTIIKEKDKELVSKAMSKLDEMKKDPRYGSLIEEIWKERTARIYEDYKKIYETKSERYAYWDRLEARGYFEAKDYLQENNPEVFDKLQDLENDMIEPSDPNYDHEILLDFIRNAKIPRAEKLLITDKSKIRENMKILNEKRLKQGEVGRHVITEQEKYEEIKKTEQERKIFERGESRFRKEIFDTGETWKEQPHIKNLRREIYDPSNEALYRARELSDDIEMIYFGAEKSVRERNPKAVKMIDEFRKACDEAGVKPSDIWKITGHHENLGIEVLKNIDLLKYKEEIKEETQ